MAMVRRYWWLIVVVAVMVAWGFAVNRYFEVRDQVVSERGDTASAVSEAELALAGGASEACETLDGTWSETDDGPQAPLCTLGRPARVRSEADQRRSREDVWLFGVYGLVGLGCLVGCWVFFRPRHRALSKYALAATAVVVVLDQVEDRLLTAGLGGLPHGDGNNAYTAAAAVALTRSSLLAGAAVVAFVAMGVLVGRRLSRRRSLAITKVATAPDAVSDVEPELILPWPVATDGGGTWPERPVSPSGREGPPFESSGDVQPSPSARWRNGSRVPVTRPRGETGVCVSGGGIRSACVALGALQALRDADVLDRARYLVSVSGGGYMAGAFQLALQPLNESGIAAGSPKNVFAPGSVEEDHLRRHGKYIAGSPREWASALLVLLRNLVASLTLLFVSVAVLGLAFSAFYSAVPVPGVTDVRDQVEAAEIAEQPGEPNPDRMRVEPFVVRAYVAWAAGMAIAGAALFWVAAWFTHRTRLAHVFTPIAVSLAGAGGLIAVMAIVVPFVGWASVRVLGLDLDLPRVVPTLGFGTSLLTYLGALVTILWRRREQIGQAGKLFGRLRGAVQPLEREVATGLTTSLIVWAILILVGGVFLLVFGFTVVNSGSWSLWIRVLLPAGLLAAVLFVDQTALSLHPFYRRRLASAFAVRRQRIGDDDVARPYDFLSERTALSCYGWYNDLGGAPQVIFGAAAAMSGDERTPPGRRAVSFTFSHDYIGGPDVGWVCPDALECSDAVSSRLRRDLTVQTAMAVSGASFASSMGGQARAYQTLLALSNARLGTWLPNPAFLNELIASGYDWKTPRLPRLRRLSYLLREVLGNYPFDERLLLCTDGGHYENLGLVELLRHGCRTIYCIDASGDAPPFATTLAESITLAWEELGVRIVLDEPLSLVPGSADPLEPPDPLAALNARLSRRAVITGSMTYPEPIVPGDELRARKGRLVVAKASLTTDMPYQLLAYAVDNGTFPRRSTADQWFDVGQFDAYQQLGRYLGAEAAKYY